MRATRAATPAAATSASETATPVAPAGTRSSPPTASRLTDLAFRPRATVRWIIDPTAHARAYAGLLAGRYARGVPMHTEPGPACRRTLASRSPQAGNCGSAVVVV